MNKHAAEKIASEYYNLGVKLAMEKVSNNPSLLRKILAESLNRPVQAGSALAGAGLGAYGAGMAGHLAGVESDLLAKLMMGGGATAGALKGLQSAPKVLR